LERLHTFSRTIDPRVRVGLFNRKDQT